MFIVSVSLRREKEKKKTVFGFVFVDFIFNAVLLFFQQQIEKLSGGVW
jgi:hypothetical protein